MRKSMFREVTPLSEGDCFVVFSRIKSEFSFPIHAHTEYELNFIENGKNAQRVVGDSVELIDDLELTLITGPDLEHAWLNHECTSRKITEITIQFHPDLLSDQLLMRNQFKSVKEMFQKAIHGVTFSRDIICQIMPRLKMLAEKPQGAHSVLQLFSILYDLSLSLDMRVLSNESFSVNSQHFDSRRIEKAYVYMHKNYDQQIMLADVASHIGMSEVAFSRFMKKCTGKNFVDALNDIRLGIACQKLVDTTHSVSEICFASGFNNLSNFNRIFHRKKGCTPRDFRASYWKNRIML
ncbi:MULTISPECIES: AraC family transcriptional regulator [unclassified Dysgonomonas]|uniref:AraC family transcriptional regulator n=1 Tax=unclassified Dysgonomonas TaxID=2630389 RepID=UPI00068229F2|nr:MULTISPECIES: AraC family transcriptional regulator [unclassified Dysgonomonas]MBD8349092.1 helix-turn-helix domain-containing protein [Dysgonomonas sp. HGC4]MBF0576546.1 helix-turn-helix domain-containing protein [Dysgonomonas sp. GY617]